MAIVFLIIGIILLGGGLYVLIKDLRGYVHSPKINTLDRKSKFRWTVSLFGLAVAGGFLQASINVFNQWPMTNYQASFSILGAALFFLFFSALWSSFYIHFYKPETVTNQAKWIKRMMFGSIPLSLIAFLILGEGVAEHLFYPLISGFSICSQGWVWTNAYSDTSSLGGLGGVHVAFYGIIMVFSAIVVYWICDHEFYKEFHKHGILDSVLLVCFPAGIIGGRIGYVIGNWDVGTYSFQYYVTHGQWYRMFEVWTGGLTILGGALGGIIAGIIFFRWRRRYVNIRWAMDIVIPTILVAQAIGRWGNFFNHEVYGLYNGSSVLMSSWSFLPTWLRYQMSTSFSGGVAGTTNMYVPLFLIESVCNLAGYFIIKYAIGKPLKKWLAKGDLAAGYMIWYGIVRFIMEPMRDPNFNMGSNGKWSIIWSLIYVGLGVLMVIAFHLTDFILLKKRQKEDDKALFAMPVPPLENKEKPIDHVSVDKPLETEPKEKK